MCRNCFLSHLCRDETLKGVLIECGVKDRKGVGKENSILNAIIVNCAVVRVVGTTHLILIQFQALQGIA